MVLVSGSRQLGFEFKVTDAPKTTKSMRIAQVDLGLDHLHVVFPGTRSFPLDERIDALTLPDALAVVRAQG